MIKSKFGVLILFLLVFSLIITQLSYSNVETQEIPSSEPVDAAQKESVPTESYTYKAEVTRLLDIIINYLYTQKDRFIREIISNSVDALEKIRLQSLGNSEILEENQDLFIQVSVDKDAQTISVLDTGIGMTKADLINNLGTIAKSGTTNFLEAMAESGDINLIGQFGVGFYSAFLVADKVTVISKNPSDSQYIWESKADTGFEVKKDPEGNTLGRGTKITLHIKQDATDFLSVEKMESLIQKFSQFMPFPIYIWKEKTVDIPEPVKETPKIEDSSSETADDSTKTEEDSSKTDDDNLKTDDDSSETDDDSLKAEDDSSKAEDDSSKAEDDSSKAEDDSSKAEDDSSKETDSEEINSDKTKDISSNVDISDEEPEEKAKQPKTKVIHQWEHINTQKPIWMRSKSEVTEDEYKSFYETITKDSKKPLTWIHFHAEGEIDFKALIYIPMEPQKDVFESYTVQKVDIKLYSRRVLVADSLDVFPKFLAFITGVIDSDDIPLNVAREQLQEAKILKAISKKVVRKIMEQFKSLEKASQEYKKNLDKEIKELTGDEKAEKEKLLKEPTTFDNLWKSYGTLLQIGCYEDDINSKKLTSILQYRTNLSDERYISFDNYIENADVNQTSIYYISGDNYENIKKSPFLQKFNKKKIEVLFAHNTVSEACLQKLSKYKDKNLVSIQKADADIPEEEEEKNQFKKLKKHYTPLIKWFETLLKGKVKYVELSKNLVNDPCAIISTRQGYSANMEKSFRTQSFADRNFLNMLQTMKIFQINPHHPIIKSLLTRVNEEVGPNESAEPSEENKEKIEENPATEGLNQMGKLLFDGAVVASGYEIEDLRATASNIYGVLSKTIGIDPNTPIIEVDTNNLPEVNENEEEGPKDGELDLNPMQEQLGLSSMDVPEEFSSIDHSTGKPKTEEYAKNLEDIQLQMKENERFKDEL